MARTPPPAEHITWLESERVVPKRFVRPLLAFTHIESAGGAVLLLSAVVALVWANSPFGGSYQTFWTTEFDLTIGPLHLTETLRHVVNDGLMTIFFFVVGLEIKRELVSGDLRSPKAAALPVVAALGGMIVPATLYVLIAGGTPGAYHGWGIPMATDIAFSVGVVALLGSRVPLGGKLFLLALAIVDDIGAITVIAVFYTEQVALGFLGGTLLLLAAIWGAQRVGIRSLAFYLPMGFLAWFFLFESGVHATLAGVALGLLTPARSMYTDDEYLGRARRIISRHEVETADPRGVERIDFSALELSDVARESVAPLSRIENKLHPWSSFVVVPLFALANAGVRFAGVDLVDAATHPVALGVATGLVVGKMVGISVFAWAAVRLGLGELPKFTSWAHIVGLAAIAGIGFTVSLFVSDLAFRAHELEDFAKTGIFTGSAIAGIIGYLILRARPRRRGSESNDSDPGIVAI
ncbi:MAG: Na+/H+ antiporter NhaA [Acidimicrobiia bacterium]